MKLIDLLNKYFFLLGLIIVLIYVILIVNKLSNYMIIAGGDFYSLTDAKNDIFSRYFYSWINQTGQGNFNTLSISAVYYYIANAVSNLNLIKITMFSPAFLIIFSYISFFFSVRTVVNKISPQWRTLLSIFYSINIFTYSILTYPWGYTHHYIIYSFLPLVLSSYLKIIQSNFNKKILFFFILVNSFSIVAYNNLGFLFALYLAETIIILILLLQIFGLRMTWQIICKCLIAITMQTVLFIPYLYSFFRYYINILAPMVHSGTIGENLESWNTDTSSTYLHAIRMLPFNLSFSYFDNIYLILPMILIGYLYINKNKINISIISIILIFFLLLVKVNGPFASMVQMLFKFPIFSTIRSPDKIYVFLPFLYLYVISFLITNTRSSLIKFATLTLIILTFVIYCIYPPTKFIVKKDRDYTYAINIPKEYDLISKIINIKYNDTSIISVPYSARNSLNWSNYPKWGFVGHDILHLLFSRNFISANTYDHPLLETKLSLKELNKETISTNEVINTFKSFSGEYVIWHKDIPDNFYRGGIDLYKKIKKLETDGQLELLTQNEFFELYKMRSDLIVPILNSNANKIEYSKISPIEYKVNIYNPTENDYIRLNQSFDKSWEIVIENESQIDCTNSASYLGDRIQQCGWYEISLKNAFSKSLFKNSIEKENHQMIDNYANIWYLSKSTIEKKDKDNVLHLTVIYKQQTYLLAQYTLSTLAILFSVIALIIIKFRAKNVPRLGTN